MSWVAEIARVDEILKRLPDGWDAQVGELTDGEPVLVVTTQNSPK